MADRSRSSVALRQPHGALQHYADITGTGPLTSAAQLLLGSEMQRSLSTERWQDEVWDFYEALGEFNYGVEWFGEALSRVRLTAAKVVSGGDEPEVVDSGPVADLVSGLVGGTDGQAQLLRSLGVQLSVPGDAYFVGREVSQVDVDTGALLDSEPDEYGRVWTVQPTQTMRPARNLVRRIFGRDRRGWEIQTDDARWSPLPAESLVARVWDRNERWPWRAMSAGKAALPIMREIDMYNRYIIASLLSRVALNGLLMIPDEVTLPVNPQYENSAEPFIAELIDIMRAGIKNPGSPSSAAPVPLRVPAEYIEKFKHFTFSTPIDERIFEHRAQALRRLATTLNLPAEIVTGMGDVNHWSAWQLGEDAIKIHIAPKVEIITRCLTLGYLHPMLNALGEPIRGKDGERFIVWYDTSELTQRPDRSDVAVKLREMMVITDEATRRETGFDEADAPTDDELGRMILMKLAVNPSTASPALMELTGIDLAATVAAQTPVVDPYAVTDESAGGPVGDAAVADGSTTGTEPDTYAEPPPEPDEAVAASGVILRLHGTARDRVAEG